MQRWPMGYAEAPDRCGKTPPVEVPNPKPYLSNFSFGEVRDTEQSEADQHQGHGFGNGARRGRKIPHPGIGKGGGIRFPVGPSVGDGKGTFGQEVGVDVEVIVPGKTAGLEGEYIDAKVRGMNTVNRQRRIAPVGKTVGFVGPRQSQKTVDIGGGHGPLVFVKFRGNGSGLSRGVDERGLQHGVFNGGTGRSGVGYPQDQEDRVAECWRTGAGLIDIEHGIDVVDLGAVDRTPARGAGRAIAAADMEGGIGAGNGRGQGEEEQCQDRNNLDHDVFQNVVEMIPSL